MTERPGKKFQDISNSHYYCYYDSSSSDQSSDSETELYSEVGYGSGHSENSLFSSDEEGLLRQNLYRRRSFTKRVRRRGKSRKDIESDSASDGASLRCQKRDENFIKRSNPVVESNRNSQSSYEKNPTAKIRILYLDDKDLPRESIRERKEISTPTAPEKAKETSKQFDKKEKRNSWHHSNATGVVNLSSTRNSPLPKLEKRKSWTDSGVSLSKTDSTGSSLAGRSYRSSSKGSCHSWCTGPETEMVNQNCSVEDDSSSYCGSPQRSVSRSQAERTRIFREDSSVVDSVTRDCASSRTSSVDSHVSPRYIDLHDFNNVSKAKKENEKRRCSQRLSQYDLVDNCFAKLLDGSLGSEGNTDSGISREGSSEVNSGRSKESCSDDGSLSSSTPRSAREQHTQMSNLNNDENDIVSRFTFSPHPSNRGSKYDSPILNAAGELITLVNSKRFSKQRISFDDAQYTPKEKEILEQLFKNAEVSKKENTSDIKSDSRVGNQGSHFPLPDHLNYPLCMYYSAGTGKENKSRGFMKSLKKLKETIKLRKTTKSSPAAKIADQPECKDQGSLDALSVNIKRGEGAASRGRRLIRRVLTRSSGRSLKFQRSNSPTATVSNLGFRRNRSGSTRSIPDSIRSMWGRARSRSVENIRAAFERSGKFSGRLPRTNSTHSLFGRKRSGSTDQLASFDQERRSALGGRRSESMRSLSAVGGFDIAVRLLTSNNHKCKSGHNQPMNSDFNGYFPHSAGESARQSRRQSVVSRDNAPNFYGLQGRLMQSGCQDEGCAKANCYRYSCYCDDCDGYEDEDRCSLCDGESCYDDDTDFIYPEDQFVQGDFSLGGRPVSNDHRPHRRGGSEMVVAPLNMTVTQERVAERRVLSNVKGERLDTYV